MPRGRPPAEFKIEKGVPIPHGRIPIRYPFAQMSVGDSFLAKAPSGKPAKLLMQRMYSSIKRFRKDQQNERDWKFSCRLVPGGVRCWRIKAEWVEHK